MPRSCDTCNSPYVADIDKMILGGWKIKEISRYLKGQYPGKKIPSYDSLTNHANKHVNEMIERGIESNLERKRIIREEVSKSVNVARQLHDNLIMLSDGLTALWQEWSVSRNWNRLKEIGTVINSINRTIELLLRFQGELNEDQLTEDQVFSRIMYCIRDFPTEYIMKFRDRWEEQI